MKNLIKNRWLPFEEARAFVRNTDIKTEMEWKRERKNLPSFIPREPYILYKREWKEFSDWLGTNNIRGQLRKYKVNDSFFLKWSHDMAYVLGFWWADGFMRERVRKDTKHHYYSIGVCQQTKDKYILEDILSKMNSDIPICVPKSRPNMSHFEIHSKLIFDSIIKLGGCPNKSLKSRMPKIPDKYFIDFIRGLFDGDGSISLYGKHKNSPRSYICSGSFLFIQDLEIQMKNWGINGLIRDNGNKKGPNGPCYLLSMGAGETRKLGNLMYYDKNLIKLKRKYDKFKLGGSQVL